MDMSNQMEILREKLEKYITESGIKQKFIASKINVDTSVLCRFLKGERSMHIQNLNELEKFLVDK